MFTSINVSCVTCRMSNKKNKKNGWSQSVERLLSAGPTPSSFLSNTAHGDQTVNQNEPGGLVIHILWDGTSLHKSCCSEVHPNFQHSVQQCTVCHMSHITCQVPSVRCPVSGVILILCYFWTNWWIFCRGSIINGADTVQFWVYTHFKEK